MGMLLDPSLEVRQLHQERGQGLSSLLAAYPLEQEREGNVGRTEVFAHHVLAVIGRLLRRPLVPPRIQRCQDGASRITARDIGSAETRRKERRIRIAGETDDICERHHCVSSDLHDGAERHALVPGQRERRWEGLLR